MKVALNSYGIIGFGVASAFAVNQEWSLPEFCWSTWLTGLVYAWACVVMAALQIVLTARAKKAAYDARLPFLRRLSPDVFLLCVAVMTASVGLLGFRVYTFLFAFYGLFLSVFAEMKPVAFFERNGFINSDFFTPVIYLVDRFWPMAAGALISNWQDFFGDDPWKRLVLPFEKKVIRLHIMVLALPFLAMIAWALFGEAYQSITILVLMALFYLPAKKARPSDPERSGSQPRVSGG
jgi:hypothetical protein